MSRKEELKTMIDLYKALLLSFLTALFGILGYTLSIMMILRLLKLS